MRILMSDVRVAGDRVSRVILQFTCAGHYEDSILLCCTVLSFCREHSFLVSELFDGPAIEGAGQR